MSGARRAAVVAPPARPGAAGRPRRRRAGRRWRSSTSTPRSGPPRLTCDFIAGVDAADRRAPARAWHVRSTRPPTPRSPPTSTASALGRRRGPGGRGASAAAAAFTGHAEAMDRARAHDRRLVGGDVDGGLRPCQPHAGPAAGAARRRGAGAARRPRRARAGERGRPRVARARDLLLQALERYAVVEQGPARSGMAAVLQACQEAAALAAQARAAAPSCRSSATGCCTAAVARHASLGARAARGGGRRRGHADAAPRLLGPLLRRHGGQPRAGPRRAGPRTARSRGGAAGRGPAGLGRRPRARRRGA